MLDQVLGDLLKVEEAGDDVEVLRRSLAPIRTLGKDAAILARAAAESGASSSLLQSAQAQVCKSTPSFLFPTAVAFLFLVFWSGLLRLPLVRCGSPNQLSGS